MASASIWQFTHEAIPGTFNFNDWALKMAIEEENRRKDRALMSDTYNLACSVGVEALNAHRARHNQPPLPTYPVPDDSGQRLRRSDTVPSEPYKDEVSDPVNKPAHYCGHPSGVECITITEHMGFNLGNALKYIWRCDLKADALEDLRKAEFYIKREIQRREIGAAK